MFDWLSLPWIQGLALISSVAMGSLLEAKDQQKRKPCQAKDGTWLQCPSTKPEGVASDYAFRPADKAKKAKSALVLLAGGPGQSATDAFSPLPQMLEDLGANYDLVFFNPRGTNESAKLKCPVPESLDLKPITDRPFMVEQAKACLKELGAKYNLNDFGTDASVQDLDKIREQLGYEKLSFYGVSYGTRLALRYAALFPDRVDRMVLEGVLPPEALIGQDTFALEPVLKRVSERCSQTLICTKAYGDVYQSYQKVKADFAKPRAIEVNHPRTGTRQTVTIDTAMIEMMLLQLLYSEFDQTLLPAILHQAAGGNLNPMLASTFASMRSPIYDALYFTIACTEDAPYYDSIKLNSRTEEFLDICVSHSFKPAAAKIHDPVKGAWPTLLLSGELDPVTPPGLINNLKTNLSNARHVVVPGKGHNVFYVRCVANLIKDFFQDKKSELKCDEKTNPLPFYIEESKR